MKTEKYNKIAKICVLFYTTKKRMILKLRYKNNKELAEKIHRNHTLCGNDILSVTDEENGLNWGRWNPQLAHHCFDNGRLSINKFIKCITIS